MHVSVDHEVFESCTDIRIGVIYEGIEHLHSLPDTHAGTLPALEVNARFDVECNRLLLCIDIQTMIASWRNSTDHAALCKMP